MTFIRISFVFLLVSCLGIVGQAQLKIGPSIGVSMIDIATDYERYPIIVYYEIANRNKAGLDFGITLNYQLNDNYSLKMATYYSEREYEHIVFAYIGIFNFLFNQVNTSLNVSYKPLKFLHANLGIDHIFIHEFSKYYDSPEYTRSDVVNRNDLGILIGVSYVLNNLELTLNYRLGVWTPISGKDSSLDVYKPFDYARFSVAYLFDLNFKKAKKEECPEL